MESNGKIEKNNIFISIIVVTYDTWLGSILFQNKETFKEFNRYYKRKHKYIKMTNIEQF